METRSPDTALLVGEGKSAPSFDLDRVKNYKSPTEEEKLRTTSLLAKFGLTEEDLVSQKTPMAKRSEEKLEMKSLMDKITSKKESEVKRTLNWVIGKGAEVAVGSGVGLNLEDFDFVNLPSGKYPIEALFPERKVYAWTPFDIQMARTMCSSSLQVEKYSLSESTVTITGNGLICSINNAVPFVVHTAFTRDSMRILTSESFTLNDRTKPLMFVNSLPGKLEEWSKFGMDLTNLLSSPFPKNVEVMSFDVNTRSLLYVSYVMHNIHKDPTRTGVFKLGVRMEGCLLCDIEEDFSEEDLVKMVNELLQREELTLKDMKDYFANEYNDDDYDEEEEEEEGDEEPDYEIEEEDDKGNYEDGESEEESTLDESLRKHIEGEEDDFRGIIESGSKKVEEHSKAVEISEMEKKEKEEEMIKVFSDGVLIPAEEYEKSLIESCNLVNKGTFFSNVLQVSAAIKTGSSELIQAGIPVDCSDMTDNEVLNLVQRPSFTPYGQHIRFLKELTSNLSLTKNQIETIVKVCNSEDRPNIEGAIFRNEHVLEQSAKELHEDSIQMRSVTSSITDMANQLKVLSKAVKEVSSIVSGYECRKPVKMVEEGTVTLTSARRLIQVVNLVTRGGCGKINQDQAESIVNLVAAEEDMLPATMIELVKNVTGK